MSPDGGKTKRKKGRERKKEHGIRKRRVSTIIT